MADNRSNYDDGELELTPEEIERRKRIRRKRRLERERRERQRRNRLIIAFIAIVVIALAVVIAVAAGKGKSGKKVSDSNKTALKTETSELDGNNNAISKDAKITPTSTIAPTIAATPTPTITVTPTPTPTPEPTPIPDDGTGTTINVCMVGDLLLAASVMESCRTGEYTYDFNPLFENITDRVHTYDLAIIDEETSCGGVEFGISGYPSFNSPHEAQDAIANAGFNVALLATNHMLDFGTGPLFSTLQYWRENVPSVTPIGAYDSYEAAEQIYVYQKDDLRVAVLNYTYGTNAGTGDDYGAPYAVNILEEGKVQADIERAKTMADYVIVCPHWGTEYNNDIDDYQRYWTSLFSAWGVDLVLGNHPHTVEPIEEITNEQGHKMIVYYSLGNCISNCAYPNSIVGGMAHVILRKNASGIHVDDYGVIPLANHLGGTWFRCIPLADYNDELAFTNSVHATYPELSHQLMLDIAYSVFGADRIRY